MNIQQLKRVFIAVVAMLAISAWQLSAAIPPAPDPPVLVSDLANVLQPQEKHALEHKLSQYAATHGTQIAIVTINDIGGWEPAEFADRLAEDWGIGEAGRENGVLVLVYIAETGGRVHISVGYGLEGVIPDIAAKRIVDQELIPHFREGNFYEGLESSTTVLMQLASGEFTAEDYTAQAPQGWPALTLLFGVIIFALLFSKGNRSHYTTGRRIPFWTLLWLMGNTGSRNTGSWGQFSSGSGRFGGGGFGGSFGGFGGGRFGGGGAGGSW